jgi:hypothetical protein
MSTFNQAFPDTESAADSDVRAATSPITFEKAFSDTERAADSAIKAAENLLKAAKAMKKAAQTGNITGLKSGLRETAESLNNAAVVARQEVSNAVGAWPFSPDAEEEYLRQSYEAELLSVANEKQLKIYPRDNSLICFPSILRTIPSDKRVRIDKTNVTGIRPTYLVADLKIRQEKKSDFGSQTFLESLYRAYQKSGGNRQQGTLGGNPYAGPAVRLSEIYDTFILTPSGSNREYGRADFTRDLYLLDTSGVSKTRSIRNKPGAAVALPASTGPKGGSQQNIFSFVSPEGRVVNYYGISFTEERKS